MNKRIQTQVHNPRKRDAAEAPLITAQEILLAPYSLDDQRLQTVFGEIMSHRVDYADLYFQYTPQRVVEPRGRHRQIRQLQHRPGRRRARRDAARKRPSRIPTTSVSTALNAAASARVRSRAPGRAPACRSSQARHRPRSLPRRTIRSQSSTTSEKVELLERVERYARALDPRVTQVMACLAGEYEVVLVARSDGVLAADVRPLVRLSVQVIAEQNGRREQGSSGGGGRFDYGYFTDDDTRGIRATRRCIRRS